MKYFRTPFILTTLFFGLLLGTQAELTGREPDWKNRFEYWTARYRLQFVPPAINVETTVTLKDGKKSHGLLTECTPDSITLTRNDTAERYNRAQLSRPARVRMFREDFARSSALKQVLDEKTTWRSTLDHLVPAELAGKTGIYTSIQFTTYANTLVGTLIYWQATISDVRLDFFGRNQVVAQTYSPRGESLVRCTFSVDAKVAERLNRHAPVFICGRVARIRLNDGILTATLVDSSVQPDVHFQEHTSSGVSDSRSGPNDQTAIPTPSTRP